MEKVSHVKQHQLSSPLFTIGRDLFRSKIFPLLHASIDLVNFGSTCLSGRDLVLDEMKCRLNAEGFDGAETSNFFFVEAIYLWHRRKKVHEFERPASEWPGCLFLYNPNPSYSFVPDGSGVDGLYYFSSNTGIPECVKENEALWKFAGDSITFLFVPYGAKESSVNVFSEFERLGNVLRSGFHVAVECPLLESCLKRILPPSENPVALTSKVISLFKAGDNMFNDDRVDLVEKYDFVCLGHMDQESWELFHSSFEDCDGHRYTPLDLR